MSAVVDQDHGAKALYGRLRALDGRRMTVGLHAEEGARKHGRDHTTIAAVASEAEMGSRTRRPRSFVRGAIDGRERSIVAETAKAGASVILGTPVPVALAPVGFAMLSRMQRGAPYETGAVAGALTVRVGSAKVPSASAAEVGKPAKAAPAGWKQASTVNTKPAKAKSEPDKKGSGWAAFAAKFALKQAASYVIKKAAKKAAQKYYELKARRDRERNTKRELLAWREQLRKERGG